MKHDELVKRLREVAEEVDNDYDVDPYNAEQRCLAILQAADAIKLLQKTQQLSRWIPVTERLPDAGERVLCYCRANIYEVMKMRMDGDWVYDTNHIYMRSFVTHWMPLPQPPKGE